MKHLIKIEPTAHGVLGVSHAGLDQQYCEAGEQVILKWQPDAKWGLQEAHYTDGVGNVTYIDLTPVKIDGKDVVVFTMPATNITIGGTFKRFVIEDWTGFSEVLETLEEKIAELEKPKYVELFINSTQTSANFIWPFEDTNIQDIDVVGYIGSNQIDSSKILRNNVKITGGEGYATYIVYGQTVLWMGSLTVLKKGFLYMFQGADLDTYNSHVYIRPRQQ